VLEFLSIYAKELGSEMPEEQKLLIIKGLLDALVVSFQDKNDILFDRIKTILINIA